jgi:antitoxin FitA
MIGPCKIGHDCDEAAARATHEAASKSQGEVKLGSFLASLGRVSGLSDHEFAIFESLRDRTPAKPLNFD